MVAYILLALCVLILANCALVIVLIRRKSESVTARLEPIFAQMEKLHDRTDRAMRDEIARNREETSATSQLARQEFTSQLAILTHSSEQKLEAVRQTVETKLGQMAREAADDAGKRREEDKRNLDGFSQMVVRRLTEIAEQQKRELEKFSVAIATLTAASEQKLEKVRETVENRLMVLQADNAAKLEAMRQTVDEKLHATLEQRLGESFKQVSERLELVHKGLGEMQSLAHGVGDLKKVLSNIKTRGTWGEVQLGNLLEQMFTPDQYSANVQTNPETSDRVEYAIKLPGRDGTGKSIWLPIDAKFPQEDYQRLVDAADAGDADQIADSSRALESRICSEAKKIKEKYICSPHTTDFAILFLPTEGLFAEVLRRPGVCDGILHDHRIVLAGPTTLAAVLSSLQMGFRTLAIEKQSSEVWRILEDVKREFGKFGDVLDKLKKKLDEARNTVDSVTTRKRALERKLKSVESSSNDDAAELLSGIKSNRMNLPAIDDI